MNNIRKTILLSSIILLSNPALGQKTQPERLDSLFTSLYSKNAFNGNVLIADSGKIMLEKSYGYANEQTKQELNPLTIFELASVSKQFTAMGIVLLEKQGKLKYDDSISKFIPEFSFYGDITVRNLLNHTGGLPDYMGLFEEKWEKTKFATNQDIINEFVKYKPQASFPPNEKYEYSNTGYVLLASIIERVSQKSFGQFLKENIFLPLKMENTFVYRSRFEPQNVENYALGHVTDSLGNKTLPDSFGKEYYAYYLDGIVGDGVVNSTVRDLLKWDRALYTDELVNSKDKELIFSSVKTNSGKNSHYGFGWGIANDEKYGKTVYHTGSWAGYVTFLERHLDHDKTIILLQNNETPHTTTPAREVRKILYNEKLEIDTLKQISLSSEDLDKYVGVYSNGQLPIKLTVSKKGNTLMAEVTGQIPLPMQAYENHTFKYDLAQLKLVFNPDEKMMELVQGDTQLKFTKE